MAPDQASRLRIGRPLTECHVALTQFGDNEEVAMSGLSKVKFLIPALVFSGAGLLGACASTPTGTMHREVAQPLQKLAVEPPHPADDVLTQLMSAEFAIADSRLDVAADAYVRATELSDDPAVAEQATRVALAAKRWDQARQTLARWQALNPKESDGVIQAQAVLALHDGHVEDTYALLLRLAHAADNHGWRSIAQVLLGSDDVEKAGAIAERLTKPELLGANVEIWIAASQMAVRLQKKQLAQSLADQAVVKFKNADAYAWDAQLKLSSGDKTGARSLFADALLHDAKNPRLRVAYARLLGEIGENVQAEQILAAGKQDEYTYAARAAYAARADDKKLIEPLYREVKALPEPRPDSRLQLLGQLAELLDRKEDALTWYAQIDESDEHWFDAQLRSAVLLDGVGKTDEGLSLVHRLQARAADDSKELGEVYMVEAELLNRRQRSEEAIGVYERGLQTLPDDTRLLYARALLNDDLNHVDAAVSDLRRVLELKPDDADAMNALGYTLADRTEKHKEAISLIERALVLKPGEPAIIDSLGWAQYRMGNLDEAIKQLRLAYQKQPDAEIAAHLGEVLWIAGQKDEARQIWEQGRKKDGKNKVLLDTMKRLIS
jgi:tetratricopeptide (TPR) repeat protein